MPDSTRSTVVMALIAVTVARLGGVQHPELPPAARSARSNAGHAATLRARGLELGYNLDYPEALAAFRQAIAADPTHPAAHRLAAATTWIQLLFRQGAVTVEDYLGQRSARVKRTPEPTLEAVFDDYVERAVELSEPQGRSASTDPNAAYEWGATAGLLASYTATVEGRIVGGFRDARHAYEAHERVLQLDPRRKDAGTIIGTYQYAVSRLPWPARLLARLSGFGGGRERGLRMVEESAAYPSEGQTNALLTLILLYNREGRYDDALGIIDALQRRYPRNRLLWLEAGITALRAGRAEAARQALKKGLAALAADSRPRAFGEEARWHYAYGAALVASGENEAAEREFRSVVAVEAHDWVRGRAHLQRGKLADLGGDRPGAIHAYRLAEYFCREAQDSACAEEATTLARAPAPALPPRGDR